MRQEVYSFTVSIDQKDKKKPIVNIRFHGCRSVRDAEDLAQYLNVILNVPPSRTNEQIH